MGGEVELAIQRAVHALLQRDTAAANQVIERDSIIDQLELTLDQMAVETGRLLESIPHHCPELPLQMK